MNQHCLTTNIAKNILSKSLSNFQLEQKFETVRDATVFDNLFQAFTLFWKLVIDGQSLLALEIMVAQTILLSVKLVEHWSVHTPYMFLIVYV